MRLIACSSCHTQYDVTDIVEKAIDCRCGDEIENRIFAAVDTAIHRCGSCGAQVRASAAGCEYCGSEIIRDKRKLSLICSECYGRNAENARFCAGCGVGFDPEEVIQEGVELPCTDCGLLMPARQIGGIRINECPECNGIWVPTAISTLSSTALSRPEKTEKRTRPRHWIRGSGVPIPTGSG